MAALGTWNYKYYFPLLLFFQTSEIHISFITGKNIPFYILVLKKYCWEAAPVPFVNLNPSASLGHHLAPLPAHWEGAGFQVGVCAVQPWG